MGHRAISPNSRREGARPSKQTRRNSLRKLLTLTVIAVSLITAHTTAQAKTQWVSKEARKCVGVVNAIEFYKTATWKWQDSFEVRYSRGSKMPIASCKYGRWVAKLWRQRAWKYRNMDRMYSRANRDFTSAAFVAHSVFPEISTSRLWNRASAEGGHGGWVWNNSGSGAGGWFQFMEGTYYGRSAGAFAYARSHGFPIPPKYNSFYSLLGQNLTAAYMFNLGLECSGEGWAASC